MVVESKQSRLSATRNGDFDNESPRAGQRVLDYLLAEFEQPHIRKGSRLPTNRQLARRLNVSLGTVQSVLRRLAAEGRVETRQGSGTYLISLSPKSQRSTTLRIGIGFPIEAFQRLEHPDGWTTALGSGIFRAIMKNHAVAEGTSSAAEGTDAVLSELRGKMDRMDGLILLPYTIARRHESLIADFERAGKSVVHIHPRYLDDTANFVATGFFESSRLVGQAWRATGRRRILTLANHRRGGYLGISQRQRHLGLMAGLEPDFPGEISGGICEMEHSLLREEDGYCAMRRALERGYRPDAVYCFEYVVALGAMRALEDAGFQVPAEVSVVAGCNSNTKHSPQDKPPSKPPSYFHHDIERVGFVAAEFAIERIRRNNLRLPGIIIPAAFIAGSTSRPEENALIAEYEVAARQIQASQTTRSAYPHKP